MIRSFADKQTEALFEGRIGKGIPAELAPRAKRALDRIDAARMITDLQTPPSHRLHQLQGDQAGRWSISVNRQYRITFEFRDGDAYAVRFEDYH